MESSKVGYWLQVGANIGILAGLVLVGFQMNQNSDLLRTQLLYMESDRQTQYETLLLGEDPAAVWAKMMVTPEELDLREQRIAEAYLYAPIEQWRSAYKLYELGLITESEWKYRVDIDARYFLNNPYGKAYWKNTANTMSPELAEYVDELLSDGDFNALNFQQRILADAIEIKESESSNGQRTN